MRVATKIAGFSMTEADNLRKACSKKIREISKPSVQVRRRLGAWGYGRGLGEAIFNKIEPFADYALTRATPTLRADRVSERLAQGELPR